MNIIPSLWQELFSHCGSEKYFFFNETLAKPDFTILESQLLYINQIILYWGF